MNKYKILKQGIILSIIVCSIIFSLSAASATDVTYYWDRTTGVSIAGYTTNWTSCSSSNPQIGFIVASLKDSASSCSNGYLRTSNAGDMLLSISPTIYSSDMQITGNTNARFYLRSNSGYATYRFDLGFAQAGTFTSLGYVTKTRVSTSGTIYTIDMSTISGIAPAGSNLALKVSITTSSGGRIYLGANGGTKNSNSGRFYVSETVAAPAPLNIVAPTDITTVATGTYTTVNQGTPSVTGGVLPHTMTNNSPSGGFPVGTTTVTWTTTDFIGRTATDTQLVTITAQTPPTPGGYKIIVSSDRYSIFSPWTGKASDTSLSANFTGYALLLDDNGRPVSGQSITFRIYAGSGGTILKSTKTAMTQANGLASVPYDTYSDFSSSTDADYGTWKIEAYLTSTPSVISNTNMKIEAGGSSTPGGSGGSGCETYCHKTSVKSGATPLSPYTAGYSTTSSRASAAHKKSNHINKGCYYCHPGYTAVKTGSYGNTNDVHKNRTCDYCHGTWSYISSTTTGNGNGIPKMPSCYQCHPVLNSNPSNISTLANLAAGNGISVYSFNFDQKKPLAAHTGTMYSLVDSVPCIVCHGPAHNNSKPYNLAGSSDSDTENENCWSCHTNRATTHKSNTNCVGCHSQNAHNISTAGGGGPDCISCHDTTGIATHKVDANAIALGEHTNLNSGASAIGVSSANKKCWGCHQSGGTQPASDSMGDRYASPYKCYDCHNATKPYTNVVGALTVSEHFKSGIDIQSAISASDNSTSCVICHNISEMKVSYTEIDGLNNGSSLASHYGKNRGELRTGEGGSTDCKYCHQNGSTVFSNAMSNTENKNVVNHSTSASTPVCTTCHNTGKLHNSSLSKPASSNDTYCKTCHATKSEHKTLYCTECHANNSVGDSAGRDIHGIKYLQKDNTFSTEKTNATNCTTCHQSNVVDGSIGITPIKISDPLHHSDDVLNGSKWGSYWSNQASACLYCHNDTKHSATPLGRPLIWNTSYVLNTNIGTDTNCADCHYQADGNYGVMSSTFTGAGLNISPEITSGSWNGKPGYYNHSLSGYTDSQCKSCHDKSGSTTVGQLTHNNFIGSSGGPDCKACHDVGGSAPNLVNFSAANNSGHKNLNSGASTTVDGENKKCWACHGDGTQPGSGHPSAYMTPAPCENCHSGTGRFSAPLVKKHNQNGSDVQTTAACVLCHDNNGMFIDSAGIGTITHYIKDVTDTTTTPYGHSGTINTTNCIICHKGQYTNDPTWGSPVNISTSSKRQHTETTNAQCDTCHKDSSVQTLANVDFHNSALTAGAGGTNCLACHAGAE